MWPGTEDRGQEKMHVDVAGTPECEEHDKWPDFYSKLQGVGVGKEEEGEQDGEEQPKRRRRNRRLT